MAPSWHLKENEPSRQRKGIVAAEAIGRGIRIERIRAQFAELFRMDGERQW